MTPELAPPAPPAKESELMSENPSTVAVCSALMAKLRAEMPTLAQIEAGDVGNYDPTDMGPPVTLPVIHMHLLLLHIDHLRAVAFPGRTGAKPTGDVTAEAEGVLNLMMHAEERLPPNWDVDGFWLASAQYLAQFIVDHRGIVDTTRLGALLSFGGQAIAMARREREATDAAACVFDRDGSRQ